MLRACTFEAVLSRHPDLQDAFSIVKPPLPDNQNFACARSTDLYPGWTFGASPGVSPDMTRRMTSLLLSIQPGDLISSYTVSIATDYAKVETLYKSLQLGPYEHLRHWTLRRIWEALWPFILFLGGLITAWIVHWIRLGALVKKRTADLELMHMKANAMKGKLEKMERIGIVNQLSSIFAHEMAQPMASMDYWLHSCKILYKQNPAISPMMLTCIDELCKEHRRAASILDRVREYAKRDVHRNTRHKLLSIIQNAIKEIQCSHEDWHDILLKRQGDPTVSCDEIEIKIVILNLLRNAQEAIPSKDAQPILVTTGTTSDGEPYFSVENSGEIFSLQSLEQLRQPLASRKEKGLGLGLQICRSIAEAHASKLHFEGLPQGGLRVTFIFPKDND